MNTPITDAAVESITMDCDDSCLEVYVYKHGHQYVGGLVDEETARLLELDRAALMEALETSLIRAYTAGHQRGHEDTVEGIYTEVWREDITTYFAEDVRLILSDGSLPEVQSALSAARANFP